MAEGVWKGVYPQVFGRSRQLSLNKFFDPSTPSMRKGRDGGKKKTGKTGGKKRKKIRMKIVATTSLPAVHHPNADCWNAARSGQLSRKKFYDPSTPSVRKGRDGGKTGKKTGGKKQRKTMKIVATTSLPAVDRPNADRCNAACSGQKQVSSICGLY